MLQLCMDHATGKAFPVMYLLCMGKVHLSIKSGKFVERCFFSCVRTAALFCSCFFCLNWWFLCCVRTESQVFAQHTSCCGNFPQVLAGRISQQ